MIAQTPPINDVPSVPQQHPLHRSPNAPRAVIDAATYTAILK